MMHIGDQKSKYLSQAVRDAKTRSLGHPMTCLELGSYCGYSTVLIAKDLDEGSMLYSIEFSDQCVAWTNQLVQYAGLSHKVKVIHGTCDDLTTLSQLHESIGQSVSLLFIDHDKRKYLSDLNIIESYGLMKSGCVVVADNVMCLGKPSTEYLAHVRNPAGPYSQSVYHNSFIEYAVPNENFETDKQTTSTGTTLNLVDGVEVSIYR